MIVRGSWTYDDGDDGRGDPRQGLIPVALAFAIVWATILLAGMVVLVLKLLLLA
jgi:hypothetical protein